MTNDHEAELQRRLALLTHPKSEKRCSAARWLHKHPEPRAGAALAAALREELRDTRTWETQHHLLLALGVCGGAQALPLLRDLDLRSRVAMVPYALGEALLRCEIAAGVAVDDAVRGVLDRGPQAAIEGMVRAVAQLKLVPSRDLRSRIIENAIAIGAQYIERRHVVVAASAWPREEVEPYLRSLPSDPNRTLTALTNLVLANDTRGIAKYVRAMYR